MMKLKLQFQYFGHLEGRANSLEKILMLGKIEVGERRGWQRMRWQDEQTPGDSEGHGVWHDVVHTVAKSQTRLND